MLTHRARWRRRWRWRIRWFHVNVLVGGTLHANFIGSARCGHEAGQRCSCCIAHLRGTLSESLAGGSSGGLRAREYSAWLEASVAFPPGAKGVLPGRDFGDAAQALHRSQLSRMIRASSVDHPRKASEIPLPVHGSRDTAGYRRRVLTQPGSKERRSAWRALPVG